MLFVAFVSALVGALGAVLLQVILFCLYLKSKPRLENPRRHQYERAKISEVSLIHLLVKGKKWCFWLCWKFPSWFIRGKKKEVARIKHYHGFTLTKEQRFHFNDDENKSSKEPFHWWIFKGYYCCYNLINQKNNCKVMI